MRPRTLLRREWFGGLRVRADQERPTILDESDYAQARADLLATEGDIHLVDATELGYPLRRDALATPGAVYVEFTTRCDGACAHCYASATPQAAPDELQFGAWEQVFRRLAEGGAYYVRLSGGEPTLREDLFDVLDLLAELGIAVGVNSHGRFGERMLTHLLDHGVRDLRFSVDGTETVHDAIRGPGAFRDVIGTLRRIAEYNRGAPQPVAPTMNVVLMKRTRPCVAPLVALAVELGCKISFGLLRPAGRATRHQMLAPEEVLDAAHEVARLRQALQLPRSRVRINFDVACDAEAEPTPPRPFPFDDSKCPIGTLGLGITATGRLTPCSFLGYAADGPWLGENVKERDILDLWQSSGVLNAARRVRRQGCSACVHYRVRCNGGCPATAYVFTGDADGQDPYCVRDVADNSRALMTRQRRLPGAPSLLHNLQSLGVYDRKQWAEYTKAFHPDAVKGMDGSEGHAPQASALALRIRRGEGATPAPAEFGVSPKVIRTEDLARLKTRQGFVLGVVSGSYDLLHLGHLQSFEQARERLGPGPGAVLVALTLSDEAIRRKKGLARPVLNLAERVALLTGVQWIDYVVPLETPDGLRALECLQPEFFFKHPGDLDQEIVRQELKLVAARGGAIEVLPVSRSSAISTGRLLGTVRDSAAAPIAAAETEFDHSRILRRLRPLALPAFRQGGFPEGLYQAALAELGLSRPPTWSGQKRAFLVTFDGASGVGKDTQLRLLAERLRREPVPGRVVLRVDLKRLDPFRSLLKRLWMDSEFSDQRGLAFGLLACGRRYALDAVLGAWLGDARHVILQNRSWLSHVASLAETPGELEAGRQPCGCDPRADVALALACDPIEASRRVLRRSPLQGGRISTNERPAFISRVQSNLAQLARQVPEMRPVDAGADPTTVAARIAREIETRLDSRDISQPGEPSRR